ncbi:MAG: hypothetical protein ABIQ95_12795 [Bdellovibrionia bacterium]
MIKLITCTALNQSTKSENGSRYLSNEVGHSTISSKTEILPSLAEIQVLPIDLREKKDPSQTIKNPASPVVLGGGLNAIHLSDEQLIQSWISGKSTHTKKAYLRVTRNFLADLHPKSLRDATLQNLQAAIEIGPLRQDASQAQRAYILKFLFSFAVKTGYLTVAPKTKQSADLIVAGGELKDRAVSLSKVFRAYEAAVRLKNPREAIKKKEILRNEFHELKAIREAITKIKQQEKKSESPAKAD